MIAKGVRLKDRYRLERPLGRGGMASVWLASDEVLERDVAVKVLSDTIASDPEFLARFRREARVAAGLSHPNLIGVYDYSDGEERPYLVMEYVPGENLAERMARQAEIDCQWLARELLDALAHIHAAGIVHRDVKPQNVLIGPDGGAKLIDFGIALPKDATALTRTGHLLGTARYIAPEVMSGGPATERSDLYSCGIVLGDCIGDDPPRRLRMLVERLSAADPRDRPASAREAVAQVERAAPPPDQPTERFEPTQAIERTESFEPTKRLEPAEPALGRRPAAATPGPAPPAPRRARGRAPALAAIVAAVATLAVAFLLVTDGSEQGRGGGEAGSSVAANDREGAETTAPEETEAAAAGETEATTSVPEPAGSDLALASALNQEGFELVQAGSYEEAVPVLEEAIRAFPPQTDDLDYAYALFNLGNALRLSGRPEEAIPVLEQRLEIPNQTGTVRRELAAARLAAGQ
jgi:serine/threonine protein kinase